jgi:hypothetical protein
VSLRRVTVVATALASLMAGAGAEALAATPTRVTLREYKVAPSGAAALRSVWLDQLASRHPAGSWAPMRFELGDRELRLMGLPPKRVLLARRYRVPTAVYPDGRMVRMGASSRRRGGSGSQPSAAPPGLITFAGTGFFGIRPGAWLLLINDNSVSWCSMAHVYGAPGSYQISTAGHCGKPGDIATVIGAVGNRTVNGVPVPVLLDFGSFKTSHDGGLGNDWALISVLPQYQNLVTPTMAFWGGPIGMYRSTGELLDVNLTGRRPSITPNPDPFLVQQVVHYGHGTGIGAGGTPRSGTAIAWLPQHFMFFGAINFGDSGSGANTLTGDAAGANRQAAGIITHIWIDPLMRDGLGIMGGTRATQVAATLANGQLLPYPAPTPVPLP